MNNVIEFPNRETRELRRRHRQPVEPSQQDLFSALTWLLGKKMVPVLLITLALSWIFVVEHD